MKRLLLIVLPLLLIVSCSKPVEDSTLVYKNGLMYTPDSDKPYTGEVFTNYSTGEKEYQGTYENGLLVQYSFLNKDGSIKEPVNYDETLNERDGVFYTKDTNKPYSGQVFSLYENGQKKEEGTYKDGNRYGFWTFWYENGQKKEKGNFIDSKEEGLWTLWYENGQKKGEGPFKKGQFDGLFTYWYENGQKRVEGPYKEGQGDGLITWWYDNGKKKKEGTVKDNKEEGLWTFWYENGQKKSEITLKDGNFISKKEWNEDGSEKSYSIEELRNLLSDKTMEEVKKLIGPPDTVMRLEFLRDNNNKEFYEHTHPQISEIDKKSWTYWNKKILYDPWSEKYESFKIQFFGGKVFSVHQFLQ